MASIGFVFSGQGDQFPGMGKELYNYGSAKKVYDICTSIRKNTVDQCFYGTEDELKETINVQPCLYATELAYASVLTDEGIFANATAGFSLGEVTACAHSGLFDIETGFRLVIRRAELMQREAEKQDTQMVAVLKLESDTVGKIAAEFSEIYPVNFNCPGQVSVAGLSSQMSLFCQKVKEAGGRAIPLKVNGGFHCPFMKEASIEFRKELERISFSENKIPVYSNYTSQVYTENYTELLSEQIANPVLWEKEIRAMIKDGIDTFVEVGPGKTLSNMIKKIDETVKVYSVSDLERTIGELKVC